MNEKYPHPQHHSGEAAPDDPMLHTPDHAETGDPASAESDSDHDWELRWAVIDAILAAIDNMVEHPGDAARAAIFTLARRLVEHVYGAVTGDQDEQALATLTDTVAERILTLADAHDDLTTSDLQGGVEALAFLLVRQQLPAGDTQPIEGGEHE
jgi:hypothetical protein